MKNITLNSSTVKDAIWTDKSGVQHFNFIKPIAIFENLLYNRFLIQYFNLSMMYNDIIRMGFGGDICVRISTTAKN